MCCFQSLTFWLSLKFHKRTYKSAEGKLIFQLKFLLVKIKSKFPHTPKTTWSVSRNKSWTSNVKSNLSLIKNVFFKINKQLLLLSNSRLKVGFDATLGSMQLFCWKRGEQRTDSHPINEEQKDKAGILRKGEKKSDANLNVSRLFYFRN